MKNITVDVDDDVYRAACEEAARRQLSLSALVQELLENLQPGGQNQDDETASARRRARLEELYAQAGIRDASKTGSAGPVSREELYGDGRDKKSPTATEAESEEERQEPEEFAQFLAELNALPREEGPSVGPLNREELYERGVRRH